MRSVLTLTLFALVGLFAVAQEAPPKPLTQKVGDPEGVKIFNYYKNVVVQVDSVLQLENGQTISGGSGSGFFVDNGGHLLTNNHVVKLEGDSVGGGFFGPPMKVISYEYWVTLKSKNKKWKAELIGSNKYNDTALLKAVDADPADYSVAEIGDPDQLSEGDKVYALGAPFGFAGTFTSGQVSVMHQVVDFHYIEDFIQTDCPINPGNSGSPLINIAGKVVGINNLTIPGADGMHWALSIKLVNLEQLKKGEAEMPWFGAEALVVNFPRTGTETKPGFQDLRFLNEKTGIEDPEVLLMLSKLSYNERYAIVTMVDHSKSPDGKSSPAKRAGLMKGDLITSFNGKPVNNGMDIRRVVVDLRPGSDVEFTVTRIEKNGLPKTLTLKCKLEAKPAPKMDGGHNH